MDTGFRLTSRLLRGFCRVTPVNLLHQSLCPSDRIGDGAHRGRNPRSTVVLSQLTRSKDAGGDQ